MLGALGNFSLFKAKISYIYILIPSNYCFQANFQELCIFPINFVVIFAIFKFRVNSHNAMKLASETLDILLYCT